MPNITVTFAGSNSIQATQIVGISAEQMLIAARAIELNYVEIPYLESVEQPSVTVEFESLTSSVPLVTGNVSYWQAYLVSQILRIHGELMLRSAIAKSLGFQLSHGIGRQPGGGIAMPS